MTAANGDAPAAKRRWSDLQHLACELDYTARGVKRLAKTRVSDRSPEMIRPVIAQLEDIVRKLRDVMQVS
jgi:hypothetical protein